MSVLMEIRRRRTRGAAMAEAAICLPVMILMWAGIDYFRRGYARRLDTLNRSHAAAWAKAYSNDGSCYAGAGPWSGWTDASGDMPTDDKGGGETLDKKFDSSMFMYGVARSTQSETVTSSRWSGTVKSSTTVVCNEVVPKSDQDVLTPLVDFVKSFFDP